jgi:hypothetical protein
MEYKLDRTAFSMLTFQEADRQITNYAGFTWKERFYIHRHLNAIAYGYAGKMPPPMDKTIFSCGKTGDGKHFS